MSDPEPRTLFLFRSIHDVLAAERALKGAGIRPDLVPVPKEISPNCGMAVAVAPEAGERALAALGSNRPLTIVERWIP